MTRPGIGFQEWALQIPAPRARQKVDSCMQNRLLALLHPCCLFQQTLSPQFWPHTKLGAPICFKLNIPLLGGLRKCDIGCIGRHSSAIWQIILETNRWKVYSPSYLSRVPFIVLYGHVCRSLVCTRIILIHFHRLLSLCGKSGTIAQMKRSPSRSRQYATRLILRSWLWV